MRAATTILLLGCLAALPWGGARAGTDPELDQARAANQAARGTVNGAAAAAVVPGFGAAPPETGLYGRTDLGDAASARLSMCAMLPSDPVCEAQRNAVKSATTPHPALVPSDPAVAGAAAVSRDPLAAAHDLGGYYSGCRADGSCPPNVFCLGERCFDTSYKGDADFAQVMTYMEAAREAGVYLDPATIKVFSGEQNRCRDRLVKNCCYTSGAGAGFTNQRLFGVGSKLVYDILMNAGNRRFITQGFKALLSGGGFAGSFTSYGITVAVNGTALPGGSVALMTTDHLTIAYDPWSLAITVVMYVALDMISCNAEEGKLAMKEGAHLCHYIGTWCSQCIRVFGHCVACIEHTTSKCCFNSHLARMLNEQGRAQLGKGWGSAQSPDCSGFTVTQLQALDFSKMNLTEFYASIVPTLPNVGNIQSAAAARAAKCYAGNGKC